MSPLARNVAPVLEVPIVPRYNFLQRYMLIRSHPRKLFLDMATWVWLTHYLWNGRWGVALTLFVLETVASLIMVSDTDYEKVGETLYGKLVLLHIRPINLFFHLVGYVFLIQGLLQHSTQSILTATSLILIGHLAGWGKIHSAFLSKT